MGQCESCLDAQEEENVDVQRSGTVGGKGFIFENTGNPRDFYQMKEKLGEGGFGSVCLGTCKKTGSIRAIKSIPKANIPAGGEEKLKLEINIMKMMDHPFINKLYETFTDNKNIYLVLELASGGELYDRIIEEGDSFTEKQVAHLSKQALASVGYMHQMLICHRDIKPENFMLSAKGKIEDLTLKLIDFGLSCEFVEGVPMQDCLGTLEYMAPEIMQMTGYDKSVDIWSCGVLVYEMSCGRSPFMSDTDEEVEAKLMNGAVVEFVPKEWEGVSKDCIEFIKSMLTHDPTKRITAGAAASNVWIKDNAPKAEGTICNGIVARLRSFRLQNKLKKAAVQVIATQLNDDYIISLRNTFMNMDGDGNGTLNIDEVKAGLKEAGLTDVPDDLEQILRELDTDGSGNIDYTEFLAAALDQKAYHERNAIFAAFRVFDLNGDGKISKDELEMVFQEPGVASTDESTKELEALLLELDHNGDGVIDFEEFMAMMRDKSKEEHATAVTKRVSQKLSPEDVAALQKEAVAAKPEE